VNRSLAVTAAVAGPLLAGIGMSLGQTFAPEQLHPLFNSAAPVVAVAAAAALAGRRLWHAVALAALAGPLVMVGYYATAAVRGFGVSSSWIVFWCTVGVAVGAVMGAATWTLRGAGNRAQSPTWLGLAAAVWPGIAWGEAAHGIVRVADSTPVGYWWSEVAVGLAVLAVLCATRVRSPRGVVLAVLAATAIAGGLFGTYGVL
jgi:hypothetical protein